MAHYRTDQVINSHCELINSCLSSHPLEDFTFKGLGAIALDETVGRLSGFPRTLLASFLDAASAGPGSEALTAGFGAR